MQIWHVRVRFKVHTLEQNFYCLQFLQYYLDTRVLRWCNGQPSVRCGGVGVSVRVVAVMYCAQLELNLVTGRMCVHTS